jgi:hypothetical protein
MNEKPRKQAISAMTLDCAKVRIPKMSQLAGEGAFS